MNSIKNLLGIRNRRPRFIRQDHHKKKKLSKKWRKPRGLHSKVGNKKMGYRITVSRGWRSPKQIRGFDKSGQKPVLIISTKDLEKVGENEVALLSSNLGLKKRIGLIKNAKKKGVKILNIKDIDGYINKVQKDIEKRKEEKKKRIEKKKKEAPQEKPTEKLEEKVSDEEKKEAEKKEKDKLLTKGSK